MPRPQAVLPLLAFPLLAGCATLVSGPTADVALRSTPSEANVTVRDRQGKVVARAVTPGEVSLKRSGKWLRPAKYHATFEKPGYQPAESELTTRFNPWSTGNVVLGGPIGLAVDAATGACWSPKSDTIVQTLAAADNPYAPTMIAPPIAETDGSRGDADSPVRMASAMESASKAL